MFGRGTKSLPKPNLLAKLPKRNKTVSMVDLRLVQEQGLHRVRAIPKIPRSLATVAWAAGSTIRPLTLPCQVRDTVLGRNDLLPERDLEETPLTLQT